MFQFCSTCWTMLVCSMELDTLLKIHQAWLQFLEPQSWPVPVWFRFASVRSRFLVFAIGPVRFMFSFGSCGSCGSWSISVRFGVWNFPASEKHIQIASRNWFHEQRLSKSGESWTRKTKASWNCQCMQFIMKKPIFAFFMELKKQFQLFKSVYWGRVRRFRFLQFGFAHGSSGSRFLRS